MVATIKRAVLEGVIPSDEAVLSKAVAKAATFWGLTNDALGDIIGVSPATASRIRSGIRPLVRGRKEFELSQLFVRLFRSLDSLVGSDDAAAISWLNTLNTDLHNKPIDLIRTICGLTQVANYVDDFRARV